MSIAKKATSGFTWQFFSQSIQGISSIIYLMVMARMLEKEAFGIFALASVIIGVITMFSEFGLGAALIQKKKLERNDITFTFYANLVVSVCLFLAILVVSPYIASFYDGKVEVSLLNLLALQLIIKALSTVSQSLIIREMEFKKLFIAQVSGYTLGSLIFGIAAAYLGFAHMSLLIGLLSSTAITSTILIVLKPHALKSNFDIAQGKDILSYGYRLTLVRLVNQSANQLDKLIIGKHFSESTLGIYERFQKILMLPENHIGRVSDSVLFSVFSKSQDDIHRLQIQYISFLKIVSLVMIAISVVCMTFPEPVIGVLLGDKWVAESHIFSLFSIIIIIQTFSRYGDTLVRATNNLRKSLSIKITYLVTMAVSITGGISFGIEGVIIGVIFAKIVHSILMASLSSSIVDIRVWEFYRQMAPTILVGIVFLSTAWLSRSILEDPRFAALLAVGLSIVTCVTLIIRTNLVLAETDKELLSKLLVNMRMKLDP